jgi:hypothetical protein
VESEGVPRVLWFSVGGTIPVTVVVLAVLFSLDVLQPVLGIDGSVGLVVLIAAGQVSSFTFLVSTFRPRAVRAEPEGIEVRPLFGPTRRLAWSATSLDGAGAGRGFEALHYRGPPPNVGGVYYLSANQAMAIRSSTFRPAHWSEPSGPPP